MEILGGCIEYPMYFMDDSEVCELLLGTPLNANLTMDGGARVVTRIP